MAAGQLWALGGASGSRLSSGGGVGLSQCLDGRFGEAMVTARRRDVGGDNAGVYPPSDGGNVDAKPICNLTSGDMHRLFVHAGSMSRQISSVKHHNK